MKVNIKFLLLSLTVLITSQLTFSQTVNEELRKTEKELRQSFPNYSDITTQLFEKKKTYPDELDVDFLLALVLLGQDREQEAEKYIDNIINSDEEYLRDFDFYKAFVLQKKHDFKKAIETYRAFEAKYSAIELKNVKILSVTNYLIEGVKYGTTLDFLPVLNLKDIIDYHIRQCESGIELMANEKFVSIVNLGYELNSFYNEYSPVYSEPDSKLYFTSVRPIPDHLKVDEEEFYLEQIFESYYRNGKWSKSKFSEPPLNSFTHNVSAVAINDKGDDIYLFDYRNRGDIMHSVKDSTGEWTTPLVFDESLNTKKVERSFTISEDKKLIFLERDENGSNDRELYFSRYIDSMWTYPENAGNVINTKYDEDGVFLHENGNVLYFSSKGHNSIGGYDIFKTVWQDSTWSKPENLGYPINSVYDDIYFSISNDGKQGFMSSNRPGGKGGYDIYSIDFFPLPLHQTIYTQLIDTDNGAGVRGADVVLMDKISGQAFKMKLMPNGTHQVVIPNDVDHTEYEIVAKKNNYVTGVTSFSIDDEISTYEVGAIMMQEIDQYVMDSVFNTVYLFDVNSDEFFSIYQDRLEVLIESLGKYDVKVFIEGHTDNSGKESQNMKLSINRAESVKDYLVSKGVKSSQIIAKGFGDTKPVASNETKEGKHANRRVVVSLIQ